jgi:hypothetical protein
MFFHILVEGLSDLPTVREIMCRSIGVAEGTHFRVHPHKGKGQLPKNSRAVPDLTLLGQLPATLRAYARKGQDHCIVVLVDADRDDCKVLKKRIVSMWMNLNPKPSKVLFRIAIEEMESWLIADHKAVSAAYPSANTTQLEAIPPDSVIGAWEELAKALGLNPSKCSGADKEEWAKAISPKLDLKNPRSPSLAAFIAGIKAHWR